MLPDPRERSRTGLIPWKGIFLLIYFYRSTTEADRLQLFVLLPRRDFLSLRRGKKY